MKQPPSPLEDALNLVGAPGDDAILAALDEAIRDVGSPGSEPARRAPGVAQREEWTRLRHAVAALGEAEREWQLPHTPDEAARLAEHVGRLARALRPYRVAERAARLVREIAGIANAR